MDADTRHQLKQNALAELLISLKDLNDPKWRYGLAVVLVVLLAIAGWKGWRYAQQRSLEHDWQRLSDIRSRFADDESAATSDLRTFISETSQPVLAASARLFLARARTDYALKNPGDQQVALEEVASLYQEVSSNTRTPAPLAAAAQFGLATTYESLRQLDKAAEAYQTLLDDKERYAGSPYVELARQRYDSLGKLRNPVVFEPGQPPEAPPATQAATTAVTIPPDQGPPTVSPAAPPAEGEPAQPPSPPPAESQPAPPPDE